MQLETKARTREALTQAIDDAKDTLDALLATYDNRDAAGLRYAAQRQLPRDVNRLATALGNAVAEAGMGGEWA